MGRFYKSSKGNYLDFIYKQPTNLLLKAQQAADQSLAQQEQGYGDLYGKLQANAFGKPDTEKRDEILAGYEKKIEDKAVDLRSDPLKYLNNPSELRKLSNEIYKDKTRGNIAAIEANATARANFKTQVEALNVPQSEKSFLLAKYDNDFINKKGTFGEAGDFSGTYSGSYSTLISDQIDVFDKIDKRMEGFNADIKANAGLEVNTIKGADGTEKYVIKRKGSTEEITEDDIRKLIGSYLDGETEIGNYLGTRYKESIPGFATEEDIEKKSKSYIDYAINKYQYKKQTKDISASADQYTLKEKQAAIDNKLSASIGGQFNSTNTAGSSTNDPSTNGTYSGLLINTNNYITDIKNNSSSFNNKITGSNLDINKQNELIKAKDNAFATGNWKEYIDLAKEYNLPITDNENEIINKYNSNYVTTLENNIATIKSIGRRTTDNYSLLDKNRIEVIKKIAGSDDIENLGANAFNKVKNQYEDKMREKLKSNPELLKLFNLNLNNINSTPLFSYENVVNKINTSINNISEGGNNYEESISYLENNLLGKDVNYLNQEDNVKSISVSTNNNMSEILKDKTSAGQNQAIEFVNNYFTTNGKLDLNKIFSRTSGQMNTTENIFSDELSKNAPVEFRSLINDIQTGQKAIKEINESETEEGTFLMNDGTRVVRFVSDGKPVDLYISTPKIGKTLGGKNSGYKMIYNISFTDKNNKKINKTIEQTLGPLNSNSQVETDLINYEDWEAQSKQFNSESRFDIIANSIQKQTTNNASKDMLLKVPSSGFKQGDLNLITVATKNEKGEIVFYLVENKNLNDIERKDFIGDPMSQQSVKEFYKEKNI